MMIQRKNICDSIVDSIIEKIKDKQLVPGDKLPNEKEMAEEYGVSRISLREALRYLSAKGLVITKHGEGSFINQYDSTLIAEAFYNFSLLANDPIREMLELRKIMESESARLCAIKASDEEIEEIHKYQEMREQCAIGDFDGMFEYDRLFHLSIAKASHNEVFYNFIESIHRTIQLHQREYTKNKENIRHTTRFHDELYEAIKNRDGDLAAEKMFEHLAEVEKSFEPL